MNYVVKIEGQSIPLPEEIGRDDESVKRALAPYYPEVANALITRVATEGETTITVVKRAGTKGGNAGGPLEYLAECEGGMNPAIALVIEIEQDKDLDVLGLLELDARIQDAMVRGEAQANQVKGAWNRLDRASARPAPALVVGF